ncbi:hypothetical protein ACLG6S_15300 [Thermodesulfobacteriota bacterium B35]
MTATGKSIQGQEERDWGKSVAAEAIQKILPWEAENHFQKIARQEGKACTPLIQSPACPVYRYEASAQYTTKHAG